MPYPEKYTFALYGSGINWAWGYLVHFAGPSGFAEGNHAVWFGFSDMPYLIAALVSYALSIPILTHPKNSRILFLSWCGCALAVIGSCGIAVSAPLSAGASSIALASSIFAGIGTAFLGTAWIVPLCRIDADSLERVVLGWLPIFCAIFLFISASNAGIILSDFVLTALLVLLPLVSQICLHVSICHSKAREGELSICAASDARQNTNDIATPIRLLAAFAALSFAWNAFTAAKQIDFGLSMFSFAVGIMVLLGIAWLSLQHTTHFGLPTLFGWSLPLMASAMAISCVQSNVAEFVAYALFAAVYVGFDAIAKLYFIYMAQRKSDKAAWVFGGGLLLINAGGMIGIFLQHVVSALNLEFSENLIIALAVFILASTFLPKSNATPDENPPQEDHGDPLDAKCHELATTYDLTPREAEIITLLAKGRSRAYIRETLFISKSTVDTHANHAYAKLGVKNKDELMRLVHNEN